MFEEYVESNTISYCGKTDQEEYRRSTMLSKETQKNMDEIMLRAAYNGGMIERRQISGMFGENRAPYENKLIRLLREKALAEIYYGYMPHMIYLKPAGVERVMREYTEVFELFLDNGKGMARVQPHRKEIADRARMIGQITDAAIKNKGVLTYPYTIDVIARLKEGMQEWDGGYMGTPTGTLKYITQISEAFQLNNIVEHEGMYLNPMEIRSVLRGREGYAEIRGSRYNGILLSDTGTYMAYNMLDRNIKFPRTYEEKMRGRMSRELNRKIDYVIFGDGYRGIDNIKKNIENEKKFEKAKEFKLQVITNKIYTGPIYYIPNGDQLQITALMRINKVRDYVYEKTKNIREQEGGIEGLGFADNERDISIMIPINIGKLPFLKEGYKYIVCLEDEREPIDTLLDQAEKIEYLTIKRNDFEKFLRG